MNEARKLIQKSAGGGGGNQSGGGGDTGGGVGCGGGGGGNNVGGGGGGDNIGVPSCITLVGLGSSVKLTALLALFGPDCRRQKRKRMKQ